MKKIIILLIAVSIMLTSCGKSAGLSNSDKRADNTPPPAESVFKGNPLQITDGKNSIIQPLTGFVNEYKTAIALTAVAAVIVVVAFFAIKLIISKINNPHSKKERQSEEEELEDLSEGEQLKEDQSEEENYLET